MTDWDIAIKEWEDLLGRENVRTDRSTLEHYVKNVSGLQYDIPPAIIFPGSTEEVQGVVKIANKCKTPLYPISSGRNWGLGSRLPVRGGCAIVDLSRMRGIREINEKLMYAVVEPGVTQGQLYDVLKERRLPLIVDTTGSGKDTSIIGNALDRGVGYFGLRFESLAGLEVVLGSGEVLRTGFWHIPNAKTAHIYKYGIGPSLDGLFAQGNFGIVTAAGVRLLPADQAHMSFVCGVKTTEQLPELVHDLVNLRRDGVVNTVVHIGNKNRTRITLEPNIWEYLLRHMSGKIQTLVDSLFERFGEWSAVGVIRGSRMLVETLQKEVENRLKKHDRTLQFLTDELFERFEGLPLSIEEKALLHAIKPLYGLTKGIPTDEMLKSVTWPIEGVPQNYRDLDETNSGMLYCLPIIPATGEDIVTVYRMVCEVFRKYGFTPYVTFNLINDGAIDGVINLAFDRTNQEQTVSAHKCIDELEKRLVHEGYIPYRTGVQSMGSIVNPDETYWRIVKRLKDVLDPNLIIAPGRYNLV
ncbi:MAG: FAD-binding oxidoreductase [Candidatus Aenigmatarchaeota archaeon]